MTDLVLGLRVHDIVSLHHDPVASETHSASDPRLPAFFPRNVPNYPVQALAARHLSSVIEAAAPDKKARDFHGDLTSPRLIARRRD